MAVVVDLDTREQSSTGRPADRRVGQKRLGCTSIWTRLSAPEKSRGDTEKDILLMRTRWGELMRRELLLLVLLSCLISGLGDR